MLKKIADVPEGVIALDAVGMVTDTDYEQTVGPMIEDARRQGRRLRILVRIGERYEGFTAGAVREKTRIWLHDPALWRRIDGYALVSDVPWIRETVHLSGFLVSFPLHVFGLDEFDQAVTWLESLPEGPGVSHRLLPETGVLVVELSEPLRTQDFDALSVTTDAWLQTHDELAGLVVHARGFPGWENLASLGRHLRFVRGHHRRIRRVAVAAAGIVADVAPRVVATLVRPEVRVFAPDDFDRAMAWAGGSPDGLEAPKDRAIVKTCG